MKNINVFVGFDPTQVQGEGCCGKLYFDRITQTWRQREDHDMEAPSVADCTQVQSQLNEANATVQALQQQLNEKNNRITELENQIANQPTVCDILAQYLDPIYDIADNLVGYGLLNPPECPALTGNPANDLAGNTISHLVDNRN